MIASTSTQTVVNELWTATGLAVADDGLHQLRSRAGVVMLGTVCGTYRLCGWTLW